VFCTSTSTGAAVRVGDLNAHDVEVEEAVEQCARDRALLVHLTDERADLLVGELVHAVIDQPFNVGESRKW
jgi:hypothetical protein